LKSQLQLETERALDQLHASLIETGMSFVNPWDGVDIHAMDGTIGSWRAYRKIARKRILLSPPATRKYMRQLCRELKRPFVLCQGGWYPGFDYKNGVHEARYMMEVSFPRTKKCQVLAVPIKLMLETRSTPTRYSQEREGIPVVERGGTQRFFFTFAGFEGAERFDDWCHMVRSHAHMREATNPRR
jgi:hypothetical protein